MAILALDTETNGLPLWDRPFTDPGQPRLLQLGLVLAEEDGTERASVSLLIRPNGWGITPGALAIHGITEEMASAYGVPVLEALAIFLRLLDQADTLVCHNESFDAGIIINREVHAVAPNRDDCRSWWARSRLRRPCTMLLGQAAMNVPRWPKLADLYEWITGSPLKQKHDALDDARAALTCYLGLRARGAAGIDVNARRSQP